MNNVKTALKMIVVMTIITGIAYPLVVTGVSQLLFADKANGSMIIKEGRVIGSELVGQKFTSDAYFWSRPSAIDYNPMPSSGSNLGPASAALFDLVKARRDTLMSHSQSSQEPPAEMVFASGSGLDPHISSSSALYLAQRVSRARHLDPKQGNTLLSLIETHTEEPSLGMIGERRVNVLELNLAVDSVFPILKQ